MKYEFEYTLKGTRKRLPSEKSGVVYSDQTEAQREAEIARIAQCFRQGVRVGVKVVERRA